MKLLYVILISFLFFSCRTSNPENKNLQNNSESKIILNDFDSDVISIVKKMTTREKIGQVLLINFRYTKLDQTDNANLTHAKIINHKNVDSSIIQVVPLEQITPTVKTAIKKYHLGNVILFAENFTSTDKAITLINNLQLFSVKENKLPMIIAVDQEGGRVNRIFQTTTFPTAQKIGSTKNSSLAYTQGTYLSEQLNAFGINLNFTPVCDVNSNPKNPIIGDRSFSSNPNEVASFAIQLYKGQKSNNTISCAKHFPGHGDTDTDSHIGLPRINKTKSQWKKCEAIPFKKIIEQDIPVIMTAHIQYPNLDNSKIVAKKTGKQIIRPATLSKKILTNILRDELGFNGVICTDALDMDAIAKNFSESQAVIEALNAGADLLCNPISIIEQKDIERLEELYTQLEQALKNGTLLQKRLDQAVLRIIQLKKDYGILDKKYKQVTSQDIQNAKAILSSEKYNNFLKQIK